MSFELKESVLIRYTGDEKQVVVPEKVTAIGRNAFAKCDQLKHIQIAATVPEEMVLTWGLSDDCYLERYEV